MIKFIEKLTLVYCFFAALTVTGQISAPAQNSSLDAAAARRYFLEAKTLCEKDKGRLWGQSLCGPLLLVNAKTREVFANQADKEGVLKNQANVFTGKLPPKINTANTAAEWAGVEWTMIQLPLDTDEYDRKSKMAHELWHRVQTKIGFPASGAANNHLDSRDGRIWLQMEWRALHSALLSGGKKRRAAITNLLTFRAYRRSLFPEAAREENSMEMHEGLADYTGIKLSGHPKPRQYAAGHLRHFEQSGKNGTFVRSFAYPSGQAYGLLLDAANKNWRRNLNKESDFGLLLQKSLGLKSPENLKAAAENAISRYDGAGLIASETERENQRRALFALYTAKLVDGAVLEIPLRKMNMSFDPHTLIPLGERGTVYPHIRIVDVWGILHVKEGGALINSNFSRIYVPAPAEANGNPIIRGSGWTLELNDGWTIESGKRAGDYFLKEPN
jgi:hypothetical protein